MTQFNQSTINPMTQDATIMPLLSHTYKADSTTSDNFYIPTKGDEAQNKNILQDENISDDFWVPSHQSEKVNIDAIDFTDLIEVESLIEALQWLKNQLIEMEEKKARDSWGTCFNKNDSIKYSVNKHGNYTVYHPFGIGSDTVEVRLDKKQFFNQYVPQVNHSDLSPDSQWKKDEFLQARAKLA